MEMDKDQGRAICNDMGSKIDEIEDMGGDRFTNRGRGRDKISD